MSTTVVVRNPNTSLNLKNELKIWFTPPSGWWSIRSRRMTGVHSREEMGHEDAAWRPGTVRPMTSSQERQTARGPRKRLPRQRCACNSWQMEVETEPNCSAFKATVRLPAPYGKGGVNERATSHAGILLDIIWNIYERAGGDDWRNLWLCTFRALCFWAMMLSLKLHSVTLGHHVVQNCS